MSFSPQFLDEVRARTTLSTLIGRSVSIKKVGREYKGCCPVHNEKTPSFYVNDEKGFAHCFGCGAHFDAISWMTDQQGLGFVDAVKELATAAGIAIPSNDPRQTERDREYAEMREIMRKAEHWFQQQIIIDDNVGRRYAKDRIGEAHAFEFNVGYAPRGRNVPRLHAALDDVEPAKLLQLGLVKQKDGGEIYDAFRGRLMFPIHDQRGRCIGFGGRIIGDGEPKYLNSPDTPLFDKGRTLFNHHRAAPAARKAGRLVIVEGYMDVIALTRAGIAECVAPNGTALTETQIQIAWKMADEPILCFDGDKAGIAAMARAAIRALPILEAGKSLSFVTPPLGRDPDDILREEGAEAVQNLFRAPLALVDVLWAHERDAQPCTTPEQVAGLKARMREHVRSIRSNDVREAYGNEIAGRFAVTFGNSGQQQQAAGPQIRSSHIQTERPAFSRRPAPASQDQKAIASGGLTKELERAIFIALCDCPAAFTACAKVDFRTPEIRELVHLLSEVAWMNKLTSATDLGDAIDEVTAWRIGRIASGRAPAIRFKNEQELRAALKAMEK